MNENGFGTVVDSSDRVFVVIYFHVYAILRSERSPTSAGVLKGPLRIKQIRERQRGQTHAEHGDACIDIQVLSALITMMATPITSVIPFKAILVGIARTKTRTRQQNQVGLLTVGRGEINIGQRQ